MAIEEKEIPGYEQFRADWTLAGATLDADLAQAEADHAQAQANARQKRADALDEAVGRLFADMRKAAEEG